MIIVSLHTTVNYTSSSNVFVHIKGFILVWNRIVKRRGSCTKTTIYYKRFSIFYNDRPCIASLACHSLRTMGFFGPPCVIVHVFDEILYIIWMCNNALWYLNIINTTVPRSVETSFVLLFLKWYYQLITKLVCTLFGSRTSSAQRFYNCILYFYNSFLCFDQSRNRQNMKLC